MAVFSVGPAVLLVTLAILAAPPGFAASVTYSVSPYKPEEKEVAQAFERVFQAYAGKSLSGLTEHFADGVVYWPERSGDPRNPSALPKYEGRTRVAVALTSGTSRNHKATVLGVQVSGRQAVVTARHVFEVGERTIRNKEETRRWKFRKEGERWRVYELDAR